MCYYGRGVYVLVTRRFTEGRAVNHKYVAAGSR